MGYKCAVDGKHYIGKPVKVPTIVRDVEYAHDTGVSIGQETVKEVLVHPKNVEVVGLVKVDNFDQVKRVENFSPKRKRQLDRQRERNDNADNLKTWNEYKKDQEVKPRNK